MKKQEDLEEFERFEAVYGKAVWEEVLKPRREAEGDRKMAAELDGARQLSNPGEQDSPSEILRGTPRGKSKFRRSGRPEITSRSQSNLMAT
jgi:hypothetical protein